MMSYRVSGDCGCELCAITVALKRGYGLEKVMRLFCCVLQLILENVNTTG
jgi:hypothetical protein